MWMYIEYIYNCPRKADDMRSSTRPGYNRKHRKLKNNHTSQKRLTEIPVKPMLCVQTGRRFCRVLVGRMGPSSCELLNS